MEEKNKGVKRRKIKNHFPVESVHLYDSHIENKYFLIFHYISILCVYVCVGGGGDDHMYEWPCMCHSVSVEVREQFAGITSLLPTYGLQGLNWQ